MNNIHRKADDLRAALLDDSGLIAFVGSGLSTNYLTWADFIRALCEFAEYTQGLDLLAKTSWADVDTMLLIGGEAKRLLSPAELRDFMGATFTPSTAQPPAVFQSLVRSSLRFFVTTNYDTNIEDVYRQTYGTPLTVVLPSNAHDVYGLIRRRAPFVLKVHGCARLARDLVISHNDYMRIIYGNRELRYVFAAMFSMHEVLFLGYGHRDPHINRYLELESVLLPHGGMRRYTFIKDSDFPDSLRAKLTALGVSAIGVSEWDDVDKLLNQMLFAQLSERSETARAMYLRDYMEFLREGRASAVWGALMYASTGSDISDGSEIRRINTIVGNNESIRNFIDASPHLKLAYRIIRAQAFKRANNVEAATREFETIVAITLEHEELLNSLRAVALRYAGMFYMFPPDDGSPSVRNLELAATYLDLALTTLGSASIHDELDIRKWQAILKGEMGSRLDSADELLAIADENDRHGFRKPAAWSRYAAVRQVLEAGAHEKLRSARWQATLDSVYWAFAELRYVWGIGCFLLLKARILAALNNVPEKPVLPEITDCIEQARARAVMTRDARLLLECDTFLAGINRVEGHD